MNKQADHAPTRAPKRTLRRKIIVGAALAGGASIAGLAFAEWLASGTGEGYAKSRTAQALTTESVTASESLYPGGTGDLVIRIHNPNPFPATLTSVTPNGAITSDNPACDAGGHGVTFTGVSGLSDVIDANASTNVTLVGALSMAPSSANECQGVTFTVPVSLNGGSGGGTPSTWYADTDADGFGDPNVTVTDLTRPAGYVADNHDCDDTDQSVNPAAPEIAGDGIDNDCDGTVDEGLGTADVDADGYTEIGGDCDDTDPTVHPAAPEVFDGKDNDCDGTVDEGG
jgi:Putative metal-binding motif